MDQAWGCMAFVLVSLIASIVFTIFVTTVFVTVLLPVCYVVLPLQPKFFWWVETRVNTGYV